MNEAMRRTSHESLAGAPDPWAPSQMPSFRSRPPYVMTEMIAAEPALAERLVRRLVPDEVVERLARIVREAADAGLPIVTTGCGTSEHAALGVAHLLDEALGLQGGRRVLTISALELLDAPPANGVVIAVSHEGGTLATNEAILAARDAGAATALITASDRSPGAEIAETVLTTEEQDRSWCHTVGYLSPLLAGVVLAARLSGARPDGRAIRSLLDQSSDARAAANLAAGLNGIDQLVVVGAGVDYPSARELALKVAEGARLPTSSHALETVLHGHLAAATRWTGLALIQTDADRHPLVIERTRRVLDAARALGMPAAAILGGKIAGEVGAELTPAGRIVLPRPTRVRGAAGALLGAAVPLQLLAERLARARGVDPDTLGREDPAQAAAHA